VGRAVEGVRNDDVTLAGRIDYPLHRSACLRGNVLGDPVEREVLVYTPPGYDETQPRRYPVVVILPAFAGTHRALATFRLWERNVFQIYEQLLVRGEVREAILVAPDAITRWGGSQFLDSPATGPYQTLIADEIVPFVDSIYRTIPRREARAVVGRSSGGFGALRFGIDRPDVFAAVGSHAGDALFSASLRPDFTKVAMVLERAGGLGPFAAKMAETGPQLPGEHEAIALLAYAAAYAPAMDSPFPHASLPFDAFGVPVPEQWKRWKAHDPVALLERFPDALGKAELVYLDAGDKDEHGLHFGTRRLAALLRERDAKVVHEEFAGGHRGTTDRFLASLPRLIGALARD
jgi:enterochelin esterase family protein